MAWTGSICDEPVAYRAARAGKVGDLDLAMVDGDLSTVATAEAAALANAAAGYVGEVQFGVNTARGFRVAYNLSATYGSTFTAFFASLPTVSNNNKAMMVNGS